MHFLLLAELQDMTSADLDWAVWALAAPFLFLFVLFVPAVALHVAVKVLERKARR
jgi:hypothetical protein